ncbi:MAG TPA: hypothetical protein VIV60_07340 [Polyangiaceae bacterium]
MMNPLGTIALVAFAGFAVGSCGGSQRAPDSSTPALATAARPTSTERGATSDSAKTPVVESAAEATASGPECKKDDDCTIFADCCSCKAVPAAKPSPVPCESVCGESKCEVKGITIVNVACDAGRCVIKKK